MAKEENNNDDRRRSGRQRRSVYATLEEATLLSDSRRHPAFDYLLAESNRRLLRAASPPTRHAYATRRSDRQRPPRSVKAPFVDHRPASREGESDEEEDVEEEEGVANGERGDELPLEDNARRLRKRSADVALLTSPGRARTRHRDLANYSLNSGPAEACNSNQKEVMDSTASEDSDPETTMQRRYFLREHKPLVKRFAFPHNHAVGERQADDGARRRRDEKSHAAFHSPAQKRHGSRTRRRRRSLERRAADSSSTGSSDDDDDAPDRRRFERRAAKSLDRARRRFLPFNLEPADARRGVVRDRLRVGASCTDVDPMAIDRSVKFDAVGGLAQHIDSLKEMVLFPLVYPAVFDRFNMRPPRGVIFYGPPGTGKTLVARALANECSANGTKVAFFMRKGADCLSKWVGESERQLRLLFDQAYTMRPAIIFFDELDGLAPVRSSRQDQIHSSIVSTLLALMDGLDERGQVVVIGATNRLDALDPALRRPGRFDRELRFAAPDRRNRLGILRIQTRCWTPPPTDELLAQVAEWTVGFCGADLQGLCTEAALVALRRRYPQIYGSSQKLQLDMESIRVSKDDFRTACSKLVPSSARSGATVSRPLSDLCACLLKDALETVTKTFIPTGYLNCKESSQAQSASVLQSLRERPLVPSCRLILCAPSGAFGQTAQLAPALLHALDHLPVYTLSLSSVLGGSAHRSAEEAVCEALQAACRVAVCSPAVVYAPAIDEWLQTVPAGAASALCSALLDCSAATPLLFLATSHSAFDELPDQARSLFRQSQVFTLSEPTDCQRRAMFEVAITRKALLQPHVSESKMPTLPTATAEPARQLNANEWKALRGQRETLLRDMRIFLREMLGRLVRDRRFVIFSKPVDTDEAPDYLALIARPMDLSSMMAKIDAHSYSLPSDFLADVDLITRNALEYNPAQSTTDKLIRHRACALRDTAYALFDSELDPAFERQLEEMRDTFEAKGEQFAAEAPPPEFLQLPADGGRQTPSSPAARYSTRSHTTPTDSAIGGDAAKSAAPSEPVAAAATARQRKRRKGSTRRVLQRKSAAIVKKYMARRAAGERVRRESDSMQSDAKLESATDEPADVEPAPPFVLDASRLARCVDAATGKSAGWSLEPLERFAVALSVRIEEFREDWDRTAMLDSLERLLQSYRDD